MGVHPVTDPMPGTLGRGDTSALEPLATELGTFFGTLPIAAVPSIGVTANLTAISAHVAAAATAAVYADLAAARTDVAALRASVETALDHDDTGLTTLRAEVEARLDTIEAKVDALLAGLRTAGIVTP